MSFPNVKVIGGDKRYSSAVLENYAIVKAESGKVFQITAYNKSGGTLYLHLYNDTVAPTGASIPVNAPIAIPAGQTGFITWVTGAKHTTGIVAALSTSDVAYADPGANGWFDVEYN